MTSCFISPLFFHTLIFAILPLSHINFKATVNLLPLKLVLSTFSLHSTSQPDDLSCAIKDLLARAVNYFLQNYLEAAVQKVLYLMTNLRQDLLTTKEQMMFLCLLSFLLIKNANKCGI
jgi:hypothetical protein